MKMFCKVKIPYVTNNLKQIRGEKMKLRKIEIISELAHFKKPYATKQQATYESPPVSAVVGMQKNLFNKTISNFIFGYTFEFDGIFKDLQRVYKEVNFNTKSENDRFSKGIWTSDVCEIHYLVNPRLTIYTSIQDKMEINECLNLGKTDCLARVVKDEVIELRKQKNAGYNQWTETHDDGDGFPERIAVETKYNGSKGYYDIYTKLLKLNKEFTCEGYYDEQKQQIIYLWQYEKEGNVNGIE